MEWNLSELQVMRWRARWTERPNQVELARDLSSIPVRGRGRGAPTTNKASTWEVILSDFFAGKPEALRKVLNEDKVASVVAKTLKLRDAAALRAELERVRGVVRDEPLDVRIPGFEDYGPIPAAAVYLPPPAGCQGSFIEGDREQRMVPPTIETLVAACQPLRESRSLVVEGAPGSGKTTLLRALAAALAAAGIVVGPTLDQESAVVVVDDWDATPETEQNEVREWLRRPGRVAVTARVGKHRGARLEASSVTLQLPMLGGQSAIRYVEHLSGVLRDRWGVMLEVGPIRAWIEDDPFAADLVATYRSLGLVLRAACDGRPPPFDPRRGPDLLVEHWSAVLGRTTTGPERLFVDACGRSLLEGLAHRMIAGGRSALSAADYVTTAREVATSGAARPDLDDAGVFRPLHALLQQAPFRRVGDQVHCDAAALVVPAARSAWREQLPHLLTSAVAQEALVAAALDDGDEVLRSAEAVPPELMCDAMPAITRLLHVTALYRDATQWVRVFRMCATWWAHGPTNPAVPPRGASPPATERFGAASPLLVLAQAAQRHRRLLPRIFEPLQALTDLPEPLRRWLRLFGVPEASRETLDAVGRFVAPGHHPDFPNIPDIRTSQNWTGHAAPALLPHDWDVWWRTCAVPWWRALDDGDRHVAGTAPGSSVIPGSVQGDRGRSVWLDALRRRVSVGDPDAPRAIVEVLVFSLERGGSRLRDALATASSGWLRLRGHIRAPLLQELLRLEPRASWDREQTGNEPSLLTRLLRDFLDPKGTEQIWRAWFDAEELPWVSFLDAGIRPDRIAEWALARGAAGLEDQRTDSPIVTALLRRDEAPKFAVTRRMQAIDFLVEQADPGACIRLYAGPISWGIRRRLGPIIHALGPREAVPARIRAFLEGDGLERNFLVNDVLPHADDEESWATVVAACDNRFEFLGRIAQWCSAQRGDGRWQPLFEALDTFEREWHDGRPDGEGPTSLESFQMYGGGWLARYVGREDPEQVEDRHDLIRRLLGSAVWAPALTNWDGNGLWSLAARILPPPEFRELLVKDLRSPWGRDTRPTKLAGLAASGHFEYVVGLLSDRELGPAAAAALGNFTFQDPGWPLAKLRELVEVEGGALVADGVRDRLLAFAVSHDPRPAVEWLGVHLEHATPADACTWWERVLPLVPPSDTRAWAIHTYFALGDGA